MRAMLTCRDTPGTLQVLAADGSSPSPLPWGVPGGAELPAQLLWVLLPQQGLLTCTAHRGVFLSTQKMCDLQREPRGDLSSALKVYPPTLNADPRPALLHCTANNPFPRVQPLTSGFDPGMLPQQQQPPPPLGSPIPAELTQSSSHSPVDVRGLVERCVILLFAFPAGRERAGKSSQRGTGILGWIPWDHEVPSWLGEHYTAFPRILIPPAKISPRQP